MSDEEEHIPLPKVSVRYERLQKILTLDPRVFKPCEAKEVEEWSWKRFKNVKFLVHLKKYTNKWSVKRIS